MGLGVFDSEIFPMVVVLKQWTPIAAEAAGGFDHTMREPYLVDGDADGLGEPPAALYGAEVEIPAQLEVSAIEALTMTSGGDLPNSSILVDFSRGRLESLSLMNADGRPKIKKGDRFVRLETTAGEIMWTFDSPDAGGLYCDQIRLLDAWLGGRSNWFQATFVSRKKGPTL